jgi:hypothetical protein
MHTRIRKQRGLYTYTHYTYSSTAGPLLTCYIVYMRLQCYRSYMPLTEQDPLSVFVQRVQGWMSVGLYSVDYYVPEHYAYMLYMYDSSIQRLPNLDYIA